MPTAVRVEAEYFVERKDDCRGCRDDRAADDGHFALVNVAAPDGEAAIDDARSQREHGPRRDSTRLRTQATSALASRRSVAPSGRLISAIQPWALRHDVGTRTS